MKNIFLSLIFFPIIWWPFRFLFWDPLVVGKTASLGNTDLDYASEWEKIVFIYLFLEI